MAVVLMCCDIRDILLASVAFAHFPSHYYRGEHRASEQEEAASAALKDRKALWMDCKECLLGYME